MKIPESLSPGDRIAILSPASVVNPEYIDGAARFFMSEGFEPVVMPHAKGPADGSFAATDAERLSDLLTALRDPDTKAILCSRGGYGCNHLLAHIPVSLIADNPKWLIGFSDISALHALWQKAGVVSLHSPMARHLSSLPADHYCTRALMHMLTDGLPLEYIAPHHPLDICGEAEGILIGGNLAVINGLASTRFDPFATLPTHGPTHSPSPSSIQHSTFNIQHSPGTILFIEDIAEQIYAVERMLIRLELSGALQRCNAIVIGHFTEYRPDRNHPDMETMIRRLLDRSGISVPVAFGFPAGHTDDNLPLPLGARASLSVSPDCTTLTFT